MTIASIPSEQELQIAVMDWARLHPICKEYLFHIPNGGYRNVLEAKKFKRMGVKKGVSDLFLAYPTQMSHGLWIELKKPGAKRTQSQIDWMMLMNNVGYRAIVAYEVDEAIYFIKDYLGEK